MEATPKVHRHRHRRSDSRHHRHEARQNSNNIAATAATNTTTTTTAIAAAATTDESPVREHRGPRSVANTSLPDADIIAAEEGCASITTTVTTSSGVSLSQQHERQNSSDGLDTAGTISSYTSQQTVVLVNGHAPPQDDEPMDYAYDSTSITVEMTAPSHGTAENAIDGGGGDEDNSTVVPHLESPTQQNPSSRNSSGDALSLRETLQQLPPSVTGHRHRRTHSPQSPGRRATQEMDSSFHRGILGFMDRELKHSSPTPSALSVGSGGGGSGAGSGGGGTVRKLQSLSDPQASPAQRSVRSRSSLEKSPRRKRSKSESRRRRERKLIAAGEMEVRQANETLMRYLKQCSEMNDASLSGELEIDQNYDERRVHRKTKSQRDKRGHLISKLYTAGGLSSILKELSDDIVPAEGEEIYNPFTPVVSPTEDTPAHIDKMFLQTSSGYRPVEHCYYKHSFVGAGAGNGSARGLSAAHAHGRAGASLAGGSGSMGGQHAGMRTSGSFGDTHCLLDAECGRHEINTNIQLACVIQRIWLLISNICHGLLAGLALAHLLFVLSSHPMDWSRVLSLAGETLNAKDATAATTVAATVDSTAASVAADTGDSKAGALNAATQPLSFIEDYATFATFYLNTFYCLAIICLVSVFDRMDICRWDLSNATELISFRWLIIAMIYIATIILTICSDSIDERLYYSNNINITLTQEEMYSNSVLSVWSSLSVTRSIGAICGWIMIGLTPHDDLLYEHLIELTRYQMTNN